MARSDRRLLIIIIAVFVGLYVINQNFYFGHWFYLGHVGWAKWLLLGLGLWIVISCFSSPQARRYNDDGGYRSHYQGRVYRGSNKEVLERIDRLQTEVSELRTQRERSSRKASNRTVDEKLDDLTARIITLEKIVTDRHASLDDEINKL